MSKNEEGSSSPSWGASFFMPTSEDVATAFAAAASAINPPRPSVVFSSKDEGGDSPLERLQRQVSKAVRNFYETPKTKSTVYNPEVLTSQKRQWAKYQVQYLVRFDQSVMAIFHLDGSSNCFFLSRTGS